MSDGKLSKALFLQNINIIITIIKTRSLLFLIKGLSTDKGFSFVIEDFYAAAMSWNDIVI